MQKTRNPLAIVTAIVLGHLLPLRKKILLEKRIGETPLQTITRFQTTHPKYQGIPATYAGRLDPMASGKLLVLFGSECKEKEQYLGLDKHYEIEILCGVGSDTGDMLGMVETGETVLLPSNEEVTSRLKKEVGTFLRTYPVYSSKTVSGKPLFLHALEGTLDSIDVPTHSETIYSISLLDITTVNTPLLKTHIRNTLSLAPVSMEKSKALGADFRIVDVKKSWEQVFAKETQYVILKLRVTSGSGVYMRTLAERIGESLGTKALALSIHRRHIGTHSFWWRF